MEIKAHNELIIEILNDVKAKDINVLDVRELTSTVDYMVMAMTI